MKVYKLNFWLLSLSSFLFFTSFNMIIPELPQYMRQLGGEQYIGLHIALFTFTAGISRPFSGKLTDQWGRIPVMIIGAVVSGIVVLFYPFVGHIWGLLALRFFHGFSTGFKPTGTAAYVADSVPDNRRGEALGIVSFFGMIGMGMGNFISTPLVLYYSLDILFYSSAIIAFLSVAILLGMKETLENKVPFRWQMLRINRNDWYEPTAIRPAVIMLLNTFSFGIILSLAPDFSEYLKIENKGLFFVYFTVASLFSRILGGRLSDRYGREQVLRVSLLMVALGSILTGISQVQSLFFVSAFVFGVGYGLSSPALFAWGIDLCARNVRGKAMSTVFLALEIGIGLGALISGFWYQSQPQRFPIIFLSAASLSIFSFIYLLRNTKK